MRIKDWKKEVFTVPNMLSLFRLVLIPVYMTVYLRAADWSDRLLAGCILAVSCLTDMVDGKIARHFEMVSTVGKILDPLADKATQFSLILCLSFRYPLLWALVGLFVLKEGFMVIAGGINWRKGKMLKRALFSGKLCTTVLFISLILMVVISDLGHTAVLIITCVDAAFMLYAFSDYASAYKSREEEFQQIPE